MKSIALEGRRVAIGYRDGNHTRQLFSDMDFTLYRGELTALLGVNGAGKSTLLRSLSGTQPCIAGDIYLDGKPLSAYSERQRARRIGVVLTERNMAGGLRVEELVALGRYPYTGFFGRLDKHDRLVAERVMERVGIARKRDSYLTQLSDGERQKVFIAKALAQESDVILLDEPTAFLDLPSRIEMLALLREIAIGENKAVLLSTHDLEQALALCDRLWLLSPEKGMLCGYTEDLLTADAIEPLFAGERILFDRTDMRFLPKRTPRKEIGLDAPDLLRPIVCRFLERLDFKAVMSAGANGTLVAHAPHELLLTKGGSTERFSSFDALAERLQNENL